MKRTSLARTTIKRPIIKLPNALRLSMLLVSFFFFFSLTCFSITSNINTSVGDHGQRPENQNQAAIGMANIAGSKYSTQRNDFLFHQPNAARMVHDHDMKLQKTKPMNFPSNVLGAACKERATPGLNYCAKMSFPLRNHPATSMKECWPRLVLIPSYPTSGSFLSRMLYSLVTGLATGEAHFKEKSPPPIFEWGENNYLKAHGPSVCRANLNLPYAGSVALTKTHSPPKRHIDGDGRSFITHIVRLVRNPGDNLIRNFSRWSKTRNGNEQQIKRPCLTALRNAVKWTSFHRKWEATSKAIPTIVLRYEELTDPSVAETAMKGVVDFIGEINRFDVNYTHVVKVPTYTQGTLFRDLCGIDMAREVYEQTKNVTASMGYSFDYEEGVWNVIGTQKIRS